MRGPQFPAFATVAPPTSGSWYAQSMLSRETLERYRRMTPGERLALTFEMIRENTPYLLAGKPDVVDRRFELLRRENEARNSRILAALAGLKARGAAVP
jgi:transposase